MRNFFLIEEDCDRKETTLLTGPRRRLRVKNKYYDEFGAISFHDATQMPTQTLFKKAGLVPSEVHYKD